MRYVGGCTCLFDFLVGMLATLYRRVGLISRLCCVTLVKCEIGGIWVGSSLIWLDEIGWELKGNGKDMLGLEGLCKHKGLIKKFL